MNYRRLKKVITEVNENFSLDIIDIEVNSKVWKRLGILNHVLINGNPLTVRRMQSIDFKDSKLKDKYKKLSPANKKHEINFYDFINDVLISFKTSEQYLKGR